MEEQAIYDDIFLDDNGKFSGKKFVYYLNKEGSKVIYDNNLSNRAQLPPYYDENKFIRAQEVFQKFKANLCFSLLIGLITLLLDTTAVKIIMMTNRSNKPSTAKIRYKETLEHVLTWYSCDFSENSRLWRSINRVRQMHHAANLQASNLPDIKPITQFELCLTIVGFVGFPIIKPRSFGMDSITNDELEALVHFWRVIGYLMGVEDRFNICRESLNETKETLRAFVDVYTKYFVKLKSAHCLEMQFAAIRGISELGLPFLPKSILNFTYELIFEDPDERAIVQFPLNIFERFWTFLVRITLKCLQYQSIRNFVNTFIDYKMAMRKAN